MTYVIEIRPTVQRAGPPNLVPLADAYKHHGFRSVVAYDETVAALIREQGGTHNLRGQPVYADTLFMDFDGHDPTEFRTWLQASGFGYEEFDSGNRSIHFHIPLQPVFGPWVTAAMKEWTRKHAPSADVSFLHNAGMYRLPGTYHYKQPGRFKARLDSRTGQALELIQPAVSEAPLSTGEGTSRERFFTLLTAHKAEGHRAPYLWLLGTAASEAGLSYDEALEHLRWWNRTMASPPRDDLTVQRQLESAYKRLTRIKA